MTLARHPSGAKLKYKLETFLLRLGSEPSIILLIVSCYHLTAVALKKLEALLSNFTDSFFVRWIIFEYLESTMKRNLQEAIFCPISLGV